MGNLYFDQGRLGKAETAYSNALIALPHYYQDLAALGRIRGAARRYPEALELYRQAVEIVPAPDLIAAVGDLLMLSGKSDEAEKQYRLVEYIEHVNEINQVAYTRQLGLFMRTMIGSWKRLRSWRKPKCSVGVIFIRSIPWRGCITKEGVLPRRSRR
jgi:tetratricopeptide (TPR) repeat protein